MKPPRAKHEGSFLKSNRKFLKSGAKIQRLAMTITVNTATLKQQLSHYLGLASQGRDVLITSHKRIVARLLGELGNCRLPLCEPTVPASAVADIGGFGFKDDPLKEIKKERGAR